MARSDIPDWQRQAARRVRRDMTDAERQLWHAFRAHRFRNMSFRRQVPVGPCIVDFVCHSAQHVVEVDGGQHAGSARDACRDEWLSGEGYRGLRFWNHDVLRNLEGVLEVIGRGAAAPPPQPSPTWGEGVAAPGETEGPQDRGTAASPGGS